MKRKELNQKRKRRAYRTRTKINKGINKQPRLSVFRSNQHIYAQLIDDIKGETLISASSHEVKGKNKTDIAKAVGKLIAQKAKKASVEKVIFDKGQYKYHGRVKALAESARENGLKF